jgi:hypothetical protein
MKNSVIHRFTIAMVEDKCAVLGPRGYVGLKPAVRKWLLKYAKASSVSEYRHEVRIDIGDAHTAMLFKMRWG